MIKKYLIGGTALLPMQALISKKPKPRKTVYKSLTGKVFDTMQEAAIDNRNASMKQGIYADKDLTYTVKLGDSLWKIAKEHNTDLDTLKRLNPSINPDIIKVGQIIKIGKQESPTLYNVKNEWKREQDLNSDNVKAIQSVKHDGNYIIIDKANNTLSVFDNKNKLLYKTTDISTGKSGNDYNTITYVDQRGHIISGKGNESTPAGITKITGVSTYHGFPSFTRGRGVGDNVEDIASSLHFGSTTNKRASNGCVRIGGKTLNALASFIGKGTNVYTLPEKEGSKFVVKDGKLNFIAENPYGTTEGSKKYWDDYNVHIDKSYSPLTIISKNKSKNLIYNQNKRQYIDAISKNKQTIQKTFNLDSDTYNRLALIAVGIAEQESKYGTALSYETKSGIRNLLGDNIVDNYINPLGRAVRQLKHGQMPHNLYQKSSRGLTQIKLKGDNAELQKIYKSFGITEDNIDNPGKSALATMLRLSHMYNTEVRGRQFSGKDNAKINPYDALVYKWMGRNSELRNETATPKSNNYISNLKKYQKDYNLYSTRTAKQGGKFDKLEFLKQIKYES